MMSEKNPIGSPDLPHHRRHHFGIHSSGGLVKTFERNSSNQKRDTISPDISVSDQNYLDFIRASLEQEREERSNIWQKLHEIISKRKAVEKKKKRINRTMHSFEEFFEPGASSDSSDIKSPSILDVDFHNQVFFFCSFICPLCTS